MGRVKVQYGSHEVDVSSGESSATVAKLLNQARTRLMDQLGVDLPSGADLVVRSERLQRDLSPGDQALAGDVLYVLLRSDRAHSSSAAVSLPLARVRSKRSVKASLVAKARSTKTKAAVADESVGTVPPAGLPGCRLGVFAVSPVKAENPPITSRLRPPRLCLSLQLQPYEQTQSTAVATSPQYTWSSTVRFNHFDPTRSGLLICINVFDEPPLGSRVLIGNAYAMLEDVLDSPGIPVTCWIRIDSLSNGVTTSAVPIDSLRDSRIQISVCFHPKVTKGPTVHALLHTIAHSEDDSPAPMRTKERAKMSRFGTIVQKVRSRNEISSVEAAAIHSAQSLRRAKGHLHFSLRGIHLCGAQCSKVGGHSALSLPDFSPTVIIRLDEWEHEISGNCEAIAFEHEWQVYSSYSKVEVEVFRRTTLRAGPSVRELLSDGSSAIKIGGLSVSCFAAQEQSATKWTLCRIEPIQGPGHAPPRPGYRWYTLLSDEEEIGLAQIAAHYSEDLMSLVEAEESPDLTFVPPDERNFDASIVQRNFERLDDLFFILKEIKCFWDETLDWKVPLRTISAWAGINGYFFCISGDHLPLLLTLVMLGTLCWSFVAFTRGVTRRNWIEHIPGASRMKMFRPIATLRFSPLRAHNLSTAFGDADLPDSFVRVFYEPNYKSIPVQLVAVTESARRTQNPEWSKPQRGSTRDDFAQRNNNRLRGLFQHLNSISQDGVLHDVVEPWPRTDGGVDANSFRLSMLQAVQVDETTGDEVLLDWHRSPGSIRFDVIQDSVTELNVNPLIGRVRVPIRSLISDEATGGTQTEFELTLPLVAPSRHTASSLRPTGEDSHSQIQAAASTISVRMQMTLRNPTERITLRDNLASEALYEAVEMEAERELSWVAKYHKAKDVAKNFQQTLGMLCSTLERFKNLFLWVHPRKTLLVLYATLVCCVAFYIVPIKYFVLYSTSKAFMRKFHKAVDHDVTRFRNLLASLPSDLDMKHIYRSQNEEFLRAKEHSEAQARLQAQWTGVVLRQGYAWLLSWQERYAAIRGSRLEFWHSIADARAGLPPMTSFCISCRLETCTKSEAADLPKDCFPLVVYDVSRSLLAMTPKGRRRILCFTSQVAVTAFSEAVRCSGEPLPQSSAPAVRGHVD